MKDSQKARVFGILFVLASVFALSGQVARAQSSDRPDRPSRDAVSQEQPVSGGDIVCIVYSGLNGQGVPIPILTASDCGDQGGHVSACSDGMDNDNDGLVDAADPGCHSDGNAANGATYVSSLDDEAATMGGTGGTGRGGGGSQSDPPENTLALCSNGIDDDANGLTDLADPSCAAFAPMLTITATVSNAHGGTATTSDILLFVDGTTTVSGASATTTPGAHAVTATTTATSTAYTIAYGGDCAADGSITLAIGDAKACSVSFADVATTTAPAPGGSDGSGSSGGGGGGGGGNGPIAGALANFGGGGGGPLFFGATTTGETAGCDTYLTSFIRYGGENDPVQVSRLQTALDDDGASIAVNGTFDEPTLLATRAFQEKYAADILTPWGLSQPTGYVFLTTRKKINEIHCRDTEQFPLTAAEQAVVAAGNWASAPLPHAAQSASSAQAPAAQPAPADTQTPDTQAIEQEAREAQAGAAAAPVQAPGFMDNLRGFFSRLFGRF